MNEQERLQELYAYHVLDTPSEKALDEFVELASLIFDTPISLITLIDKDREWYKAVKGLDTQGIERTHSFCQHTIPNPGEILAVPDTLNDLRFKDNLLVKGEPKIRFYAGAPLVTPNGYVLGTLCVIDHKAKEITPNQEEGLKLLAKKVMNYLNIRKEFSAQSQITESYTQEILKLTDEIPGVIYQFRMNGKGAISFDFFSKGVTDLYPGTPLETIRQEPQLLRKFIHPEDLPVFQQKIMKSFKQLSKWEVQFRLLKEDGTVEWHMGKATPRKEPDGSVVWCGFFHNINRYKQYEEKMEQLAFDISHVLRKPVANLLGLTTILEEKDLDVQQIIKYIEHIKTVADELERFTINLNETYKLKPEVPGK